MHIPASAYLPMTRTRALNCVLLVMFALGLGKGAFVTGDAYAGIDMMVGLTINYIGLLWYRSDRDARGMRRSRLRSAAVFLFPLAAIPVYLARSREVNDRGNALGAFFGILLLMPFTQWVGIFVHQAIRQPGA